ncbi:MAG: winged helix-turn-helix transcriptional regulator [Candidatus Thermoplasmatota archaeon]
MNLLRNKNLSTQILILYELHTNAYSKLKPLAIKLGITQQAVSEYIRKMKQQNLICREERHYKPTIQGVALLHEELSSLKQFADASIKNLSLITHCIALAAAPLKKGQQVGLYMDDGWLWAHPQKNSPSTGIALTSADTHDPAVIGNLKGILDHTIGDIYLFQLQQPTPSTTTQPSLKRMKQQLQRIPVDLIACLDPVAYSICRKIGVKPEIQYSAAAASIDAAQRGRSVAVFGSKDSIQNTLRLLEQHNDASTQKINYNLILIQ